MDFGQKKKKKKEEMKIVAAAQLTRPENWEQYSHMNSIHEYISIN